MQKYLLYIYILLPCSVLAWRHSLLQAKSLHSCTTGGELSRCVDNYRHNNLFLRLYNTIIFISCLKATQRFYIFRVLCRMPYGEIWESSVCLRSFCVPAAVLAEAVLSTGTCAELVPRLKQSFCTAPVFILINTHTLPCPVLQS